MRPLAPVTLSNVVASSAWIPLDIYATASVLTLNCDVTGTVTFQVDFTNDDVWNNPTPDVDGQVVASGSASVNTTVTNIPRAIRLTQTAGTGSVTMWAVQQGLTGV